MKDTYTVKEVQELLCFSTSEGVNKLIRQKKLVLAEKKVGQRMRSVTGESLRDFLKADKGRKYIRNNNLLILEFGFFDELDNIPGLDIPNDFELSNSLKFNNPDIDLFRTHLKRIMLKPEKSLDKISELEFHLSNHQNELNKQILLLSEINAEISTAREFLIQQKYAEVLTKVMDNFQENKNNYEDNKYELKPDISIETLANQIFQLNTTERIICNKWIEENTLINYMELLNKRIEIIDDQIRRQNYGSHSR